MIINLAEHADHPVVKAGYFTTKDKGKFLQDTHLPELRDLRMILSCYGAMLPNATTFALAFVNAHLKKSVDSSEWIPKDSDVRQLYFSSGMDLSQNHRSIIEHIQRVAIAVRDIYLEWFAPPQS